MSISFNAIKGYKKSLNIGSSSYNSTNYDNNKLYTNGNPTNWDGHHNITKEPRKSIHTRYKEKVGTEIIYNMNRDTESFDDRHSQNINIYPSNQNIMTTGINYGSTPYKIGRNGQGNSALPSCNFNIADYITDSQEHALSRKPVETVHIHSNLINPSTDSNLNRTPQTKSINENYLTPSIQSNKIDNTIFVSNINKNIHNNKSIKENYVSPSINVNKQKSLNNNRNISNLDTSKHINGAKLSYDIHTNKYQNNNFNNINGKNQINTTFNENYKQIHINTNLQSNEKVNNINRDQNRRVNHNIVSSNLHTNLKKNFNEIEVQRPNINLQSKVRVNESYNNNRTGVRQQTKNLNYKL
jgi:hypothetical protein